MFKRTGMPHKISEVIAFDLSKAKEVMCTKCEAYVGLRCGKMFKSAGKGARIVASKHTADCPKCGAAVNV